MMVSDSGTTFAAAFAALYAGHVVADHWLQTEAQAVTKGAPGWPGRLAAGRHVAILTALQLGALLLAGARLHLALPPASLAGGLALNAATHWWADRRWTLAWLASRVGKAGFAGMGGPLGGAYLLDQAWHVGALFVAALVIA